MSLVINWMQQDLDGALPSGAVTGVDSAAITDDSIVSADIKAGTIVNSDISATAGITEGKLAIANTKILIGSAGGVGAAFALSNEATMSAGGAVTLSTTAVTGKALTGFVSGAGVVAAADTILSAFNKLDGNVVALSAAGVGGALADGLIIVGSGAGAAAAVALSGDASIINTGAITVTGSTGAFAVGTKFSTGNTTTSAGAGAVAVTGAIHEVTTTGTGDALTLADGTEGQHLYVVYVAEGAGGDTAVLTPTNLAGANTTVTFTDLGDSAHLLFTAGTWFFLGGEAVVG